ncbi:SH3 domain-containing protein [Fructilactobacillus myrtifloralis]|uniref:SH3 domain-containing protein n=1 Tax=Fructilactobacillus myrtifloralis TaxID=2940301 RepID=A0ABY5BPI5_9LACO|nr:GH25 family lysozyme [Fructilactobacillus myrtifloralis]USS85096.1 SH3 domain-containing protein [Fructilactobacillus myrtifloralis]
MADFPLVVDVAKFQDSSVDFFQSLKDQGVQSVIVQLTAGSKGHPYSKNPKRAEQVANARAVGLRVHAYHYSYAYGHDDMLTEVDNFMEEFRDLGFDPSNDFAFLDEEDNSNNPNPATDDVNTWTDAVFNAGVRNVGVYSMASWFTSGRINFDALHCKFLWVANYGVSQPGVDNTSVWQFTDNFFNVDCSYDFFGNLTGTPIPSTEDTVQPQPVPQTDYAITPENGGFIANQTINVRMAPTTSAPVTGQLESGDGIVYYGYVLNEGFVWIAYKNASGQDRFCVCREQGGPAWGTFN